LTAPHQRTLMKASVLGRSFTPGAIRAIYPPGHDATAVPDHLHELARHDLTPLEDAAAGTYAFKHVITQDVVYKNLGEAERRAAHERAGAWIEQTDPDNAPLLAYHYGRGDNLDKRRLYLRRAAEAAQAASANEAAITGYTGLADLLEPADRLTVMLQLGAIWQLVGKWAEAEAIFGEALATAESLGDARAVAEAQMGLGNVQRERGTLAPAATYLEQARTGFAHIGDREGLLQVAGFLGRVYWMQDNRPQALALFREQLHLAQDLGNRQGTGRALVNLGIVYNEMREVDEALSHLEGGLALAVELGDRAGQQRAYWGLASLVHGRREYARALDYYTHTMNIAQEIGDRRATHVALSGMGYVYLDYGDYTRALACIAHQLSSALALGDLGGITPGIGNIAIMYAHQGWEALAERLMRATVTMARTLDTPYLLAVYLFRTAELRYQQGQYAAAAAANAEAARLAVQVEDQEFTFNTTVLAVALRLQLGELTPAAARAACTTLLAEWPSPTQQAEILYTRWRLDPRQADARDAAAAAYRNLYASAPTYILRDRYEELTGERLPDPPALPDLPAIVTRQVVDLPALLTQVESLVESLAAGSLP
ncbi:MAG TPA: tetratricopeptide repeat protein, partial [Chloroflexia bacterium]|nr:tetratricopeptide repeat protein [Chloroflexia bacterium]